MDAPARNDLTGGTSTATERRVQFLESVGKSAGMGDTATGTGGDGMAAPRLRDSVALSWPCCVCSPACTKLTEIHPGTCNLVWTTRWSLGLPSSRSAFWIYFLDPPGSSSLA